MKKIREFIIKGLMRTELLLECKDKSILITDNRDRNEIVIAVPHHAPLGVSQLPCKTHCDADENAGFLGHYTAQLLNCCSVIACNYFIDSNKTKESDFFKKIRAWEPKILVEIHGHGGDSAKYDIEISSGSMKRNNWSEEMASRMLFKLATTDLLQNYTISGDFNKIYFKASKTITITTDDWIAFHIELPKSIREEKSKYDLFCKLLADTINELLGDYNELSNYERK